MGTNLTCSGYGLIARRAVGDEVGKIGSSLIGHGEEIRFYSRDSGTGAATRGFHLRDNII